MKIVNTLKCEVHILHMAAPQGYKYKLRERKRNESAVTPDSKGTGHNPQQSPIPDSSSISSPLTDSKKSTSTSDLSSGED